MMIRTISSTDIAALQAVRSVIADAFEHPGRQAAIEAIDRLSEAAEPDPGPGELFESLFGIPWRGQAVSVSPPAPVSPEGFTAGGSFVVPQAKASEATCKPVKRWRCSDCNDAAETSPDRMRYPCGRCGGWMERTWANPACHVCGGRLMWEKSVDMNVFCNGGIRTVTTCGSDECRDAVERTNHPVRLYAVRWTKPDGRSGLGAERASYAYLKRSLGDGPEQGKKEGMTYEIVPAPEGDKEWRWERHEVPVAWLDEASELVRSGATLVLHGDCDADCWKCKAERFLESL